MLGVAHADHYHTLVSCAVSHLHVQLQTSNARVAIPSTSEALWSTFYEETHSSRLNTIASGPAKLFEYTCTIMQSYWCHTFRWSLLCHPDHHHTLLVHYVENCFVHSVCQVSLPPVFSRVFSAHECIGCLTLLISGESHTDLPCCCFSGLGSPHLAMSW